MSESEQNYQQILDQVFSEVKATGHLAAHWDEEFFKLRKKRYIHDISFLAEHFSGGPILEIGALPGHVSLFMKKLGYDISSVDINPERIQPFIDKNQLKFSRCNIQKEVLPFPDSSFNGVIFTEVFEHLGIDPLFVLSEINRVLKAGGIIFMSTPNLYALDKRIKHLRGRSFNNPLDQFKMLRKAGHLGHIREYSIKEVTSFLKESGFAIIDSRYHNYHDYGGGLMKAIVNFLQLPSRQLKARQVHIAKKVKEITPPLKPLDQ